MIQTSFRPGRSTEVGDYVKSFDSFQELHQEIVATDSLLEKMLGLEDGLMAEKSPVYDIS
jgi:hypothetical protein